MDTKQQKLSLKREVGIIGAMSFIAGTMVGSGIFISPQYVLLSIGSPGASLIIWTCCGLTAMLGGLCYAELGTVIPGSGGEYIYMLRTVGKIVAFMFVFSFVIVMRPVSATGVALACAEYVIAPFYSDCTPSQLVLKCVAAGIILLLSLINCLSVRLATGIQVVTTLVKAVVLVVIIVGGVVMLFQGNNESFDDAFEGTKVGVSSIGIAFYQGLWSYDGWNTMNYLTEELKRPENIMAATQQETLKMKRVIRLVGGVSLVSGTMIGSGIFMSPQFVMTYVESPGATFTFILLMKPFGITAMAISIAECAMAPFYSGCQPPHLAVKCTAASLFCLLPRSTSRIPALLLRVQVVFWVAKVITLIVIVIGGIVKVIRSRTVIVENLKVEKSFEGTQFTVNTLGMAFYQGLWSYAGWYNLNYVTE
uniref:B(0,+)-type amino acid transporter 1 n=1 Tax=Nothobranchius furzeri TaxID=105023 RepID=A0A1A8UBC5_NOTFU